MILYDGVHVTSDTSREELHQWAREMGISKSFYHGYRKGHPHYDIPASYRNAPWPSNMRRVRPREILLAAKSIM